MTPLLTDSSSSSSSSSSCTLLLKQVPSELMGDVLSCLEIDRLERDMELIEYLPMIRSRMPDLHRKVTDVIDHVCAKYGVDSIPLELRDPDTGILTSMKRRVEIIESFRVLKLAHYNNCIVGDDDPFAELPNDIVEMILLEVLSNLKTDMDLLKALPIVKKYLPSLHKAFISIVDPVKDDEPCMDVLRCMSKPELIEFMMERGVYTSHRYSREMLLKECVREFERDGTGLRTCIVESVHMYHIYESSKHSKHSKESKHSKHSKESNDSKHSKDSKESKHYHRTTKYVSVMMACLSEY